MLLGLVLFDFFIEICLLQLLEAVPEFAQFIMYFLLFSDFILHQTRVLSEVPHSIPHVTLCVDRVSEERKC
jgi:hypothetical protein